MPEPSSCKLGQARREALLAVLTGLANAGKPMVTNNQIAAVLGVENDHAAQSCLRGLEAHGLIKVEYTGNRLQRRVTIVATGKKTDWQPKTRRKVNPNSRRSQMLARKAAGEPSRGPSSLPLVFQRSVITAGYSDTILYGKDADAVRALRRSGDTVWRERGQYKVNGRFMLDSEELRARAARAVSRSQ